MTSLVRSVVQDARAVTCSGVVAVLCKCGEWLRVRSRCSRGPAGRTLCGCCLLCSLFRGKWRFDAVLGKEA